MPKRIKLTKSAYEKIAKELDHLVRVVRPVNIEAIKHAAGHGDLTENAAYEIAKEEQVMLETRIRELRMKLASAEVVAVPEKKSGVVALGSRVRLRQKDSAKDFILEIVDSEEADSSAGKISAASPVGKALLGRKPKEKTKVKTPKGEIEYEILALE